MNISKETIKKRVFKSKIYNLHVKEFMLGQTSKFIDKTMNVLDVGAAVGMYSHFFAKHCQTVFAFEPVAEVYSQLLNTVHSSAGNIIPFKTAISDFCGKTKFYIDTKRLSNNGLNPVVNNTIEVEVGCITVDSFVKSRNLDNIGFIKIDTEGSEWKVIKGAKDTIEKFGPTCMVEIHPIFTKDDYVELFNYFFDLGYRCYYNNRGHGLVEVKNTGEAMTVALDKTMVKVHDMDFLFSI